MSVWDKDTAGSDDSLGDGIVEISALPVGQETFFLVELFGGESGENIHGVIDDKVQPMGQNIASVTAQNAIGGEAGKLAGHIIKKIPQGKENKNKGTIALGITLSSPLGSSQPAPMQRSIPTREISVVEGANDLGCPP
uniref:Uncharacterized protein n=2 Tax=Vannella robusta TaxID=1487602 RepID=A0A7S4MSA6_9EUKA|mmetsp:Transcript_8796/g.10877  ORF Transcript_8796/g.10877 Transcript_8796/m.10877 type:complete len:138 (+) Transcript_8796:208-621(+)